MRTSDHDMRLSGEVIPFQPKKEKTKKMMSTTIAALIAVTIVHDETESPEDKLIELIEATGEAEVMDSSDALDMLAEIDGGDIREIKPKASANDND